MHRPLPQLAYWTPRILALFFAAFLALFSLDVLGTGLGFWKTAAVLALHLVPAALVLVVLAIAWRWEPVGAGIYLGFAVAYLLMALGRVHWSAIVVISGSLTVLGLAFLVAWRFRPPRPAPPAP